MSLGVLTRCGGSSQTEETAHESDWQAKARAGFGGKAISLDRFRTIVPHFRWFRRPIRSHFNAEAFRLAGDYQTEGLEAAIYSYRVHGHEA